MALGDIHNFRTLPPAYGTAGQPRAGQFAEVARAGYRLVVNLAHAGSPGAVADEPARWAALGVPYVNIPVDFAQPRPEDYQAFAALLDRHRAQPVFVHCAYNWRVSVFMALYRILALGVAPASARAALEAVWTPDPVWEAFMRRVLEASASRPVAMRPGAAPERPA